MTTNKPEVLAYATHHDEPMLFPSKREAATYCDDKEEPLALISLSDYEALQAECEKLRSLLIEIERGCSRRDIPSEQTISSWADAIDTTIQEDNP